MSRTIDKGKNLVTDVLVIGSGAGGMATAISAAHKGRSVLVVEKESRFGGSTARSGGWLWVPGTHLARQAGISESPGGARRYLQHVAGMHFDAARVEAFLEAGPEAIDFFARNTELQFDAAPGYPDYYAEAPGATSGGRSIITRPFDGRRLGSLLAELAPPLPEATVMGMMLGSGREVLHFLRAFKSATSFLYVAKRFGRHLYEVSRFGRAVTLTNGNALAARLACSAKSIGVELRLSTSAVSLSLKGNRVVGATIAHAGGSTCVRVRTGVVLACGGFSHDPVRQRELFSHAASGVAHHSPVPTGNTGDGLRLAESIGARIESRLHEPAAWVPVSLMTRRDGTRAIVPHFIDRAKPGVIAVDGSGQRFCNESDSYHDFVRAMLARRTATAPGDCWLVCGHRTLREYGLGRVARFPFPIGHYLRSGYLKRGRTIAELACAMGIDERKLSTTIAEFNRHARRGNDPAFGKGSTIFNRFMGDPYQAPNPCVSELGPGPFYAIRLQIGDIGTFAGIAVDAQSRVLGKDGSPIAGLYAVGNDAVSIMGGTYPGAGITLGPAIVFGWCVGRELAAEVEHNFINQAEEVRLSDTLASELYS